MYTGTLHVMYTYVPHIHVPHVHNTYMYIHTYIHTCTTVVAILILDTMVHNYKNAGNSSVRDFSHGLCTSSGWSLSRCVNIPSPAAIL